MTFLIIFSGLVAIVLVYLIVIVFFPVLDVSPQVITGTLKTKKTIPICRTNIDYSINGELIRSWLYLPDSKEESFPCIILCNGFGGTKDIILEQYAMAFVNEGLASLALEYRHFGESDGQPRQFYSSIKQVEDIKASVKYVRSLPEIDSSKVFIWGTSAGGGYGINVAADDSEIKGVMAQCTSLDHKKDEKLVMKREGLKFMFKIIAHAQRDKGRSRFGLSPHMIPLVGIQSSTAMLNAPGALEGYAGMIHEKSLFRNEICPRIMLMKQGELAENRAKDVRCPVLILVCENDELVAPDSYEKAAEFLGDRVKVVKYPIKHFDIYKGENFEKAVREQINFIKDILQDGLA